MSFPKTEELTTLAQAKDAYDSLLSALSERDEKIQLAEQEVEAAQELMEEQREQLQQKDSELEEAATKQSETEAKLTEATEQVRTLQEKVDTLEAEKTSVEEEAARMCASVGVEAAEVSPSGEHKQQDLLAQFNAITDPAKKTAFYREHKAELLRA
jgi:chromosome segregation ATPase